MQPIIDFFASPAGALIGVTVLVLVFGVAKFFATKTKTKIDDWAIERIESILIKRGVLPAEPDSDK